MLSWSMGWRTGRRVVGNSWRRALLLGVSCVTSSHALAITDIAFDNPLQAFQSSAFSEKFVAVGAHQPKYAVRWQVGPPGCLTGSGLALDAASGILSGAHPGTLGEYQCTITGTDSFDATAVTKPFTLIIKKKPFCSVPKFGSTALPAATLGVPYHFALQVSGSPAPVLSVTGLPDGMKFDPASAMISGAPTTPGSFTVTISATNRCAPPVIRTETLTVAPGSTAVAVIATPNPALFGDPVSVTVTTSVRKAAQGAVQLCVRASAGYCGPPFDVVPPGTPPDQISPPLTGALDASGHAQFSLAGLLIDHYTLTAMYAGDGTHLPATSAPVDEYVIKGVMLVPPQVVVAAPLNASAALAMNVRVTVTPKGAGPTPTGSVQLLGGNRSFGISTLDASGIARFDVRADAGRLTLRAEYRGDTWFPSAASAEADVVVAAQDPSSIAAAIPALSLTHMVLLSVLIAMLGLLVLWRRALRH